MNRILCFILLVSNPFCSCHGKIGYQDLEVAYDTCYQFNNCGYSKSKCFCDSKCIEYNDCCLDSWNINNWENTSSPFICLNINLNTMLNTENGVYVNRKCPRVNKDRMLCQKCENVNIFEGEIELRVPVFSRTTSITYQNYYCALCNNDGEDLQFWDVEFFCKSNNQIFSNIEMKEKIEDFIYNEEFGIWGFWLIENEKEAEWVPCKTSIVMPPDIRDARNCQIDMISECNIRWEDAKIRHMCRKYQAPRYSSNGNIYKNIHCAICSYVNVTDLECSTEPERIHFAGRPNGLKINFADLIDINLKKGNRIGKIRKCPNGHIYDPSFEQCKQLVCTGNRKLIRGKCVAT